MKYKIGIYWPTKGRELKLNNKNKDLNPNDFLYGISDFYANNQKKCEINFLDSRKRADNFIDIIEEKCIRLINKLIKFKFFYFIIKNQKNSFFKQDLIVSFTDSGSLSLGVFGNRYKKRPKLIGGFHGLADILDEINPILRFYYKLKIKKSLVGLNHIFFFGEKDREESINLFDIKKEKTSIFKFGVDTNFWFPSEEKNSNKNIFSVGSDPQRDYETLVSAPYSYKTEILTDLDIKLPTNAKHIKILKGSYFKKGVSNTDLRKLYQDALMVVVPLKNVFQPTGYSVTLQAMACGKPVILPKFRGLWDKRVFKNSYNCVFYKPHDANDLGSKINNLINDKELLKKLSKNSRKTALNYFNISRMNADFAKLIDLYMNQNK